MVTAFEPRFRALIADHAAGIARLCRAMEREPERRRELEQEILLALWRALPAFRGDCSERTWVLRVAHNVAATHVAKGSRDQVARAVSLEEVELPASDIPTERAIVIERVHMLIERLTPVDRQVLLLWLEGLTARDIAEVTGFSATNVTTKVHRAKAILARAVAEGP
jgi:RNA polymerase sigma-70 factor (ECF subfamily)